jgi:cytochrome c556
MRRSAVSLAAALFAVGFMAAPLLASSADDVRIRVSGLRELGAAFKAVNDGLRTSEPQTILIQQSAREIRNAASQMPGWFPKGSGPESGAKTAAKADIWAQPAKFKAAQDAFIAEAARLQAAANGGDVAAIRAETTKLGLTCKNCHDSFRVPKA